MSHRTEHAHLTLLMAKDQWRSAHMTWLPWFALIIMALPSLVSAAEVFGIDALATLLKRDHASQADYVEHQYRRALTTPIAQSGQLLYTPPETFEKRITQPVTESYRLSGDTLTVAQQGRKPRQISVRNQPILRGLLVGFQAVVSGQLDRLVPFYQADVSGTAAQWTLQLTATDAQIRRYVSRIIITGQQAEPARFEVQETSGDRVVTEIRATRASSLP